MSISRAKGLTCW